MAGKLTLEDYQAASLGLKGLRELSSVSTAGEHFIGFRVTVGGTVAWTCNNPKGDATISAQPFVAGDVVTIGDGTLVTPAGGATIIGYILYIE